MLDSGTNPGIEQEFKLLLDTSLTDGNAAVRTQWCISIETQLQITSDGFNYEKAQVLIVTLSEDGTETRSLCPVGEIERFTILPQAGVNWVLGAVVWGRKNNFPRNLTAQDTDEKFVKQNLVRMKNGIPRFDKRVLYRATGQAGVRYKVDATPYRLEVDEAFFAPKWPDWLEQWMQFRYGPWKAPDLQNECDRWRYVPIAFTIQPLAVGVLMLCRIFLYMLGGALSILLALRGYNWRGYNPIKPLRPGKNWGLIGGWFIQTKFGEPTTWKWYLWPFTPIVPLLLCALVWLIADKPDDMLSLTNHPIKERSLWLTAGLVGVVFVAMNINLSFGFKAWRKRRQNRKEEQRRALLSEELSCAVGDELRTTSAFHSLRLMMAARALKARICKPLG